MSAPWEHGCRVPIYQWEYRLGINQFCSSEFQVLIVHASRFPHSRFHPPPRFFSSPPRRRPPPPSPLSLPLSRPWMPPQALLQPRFGTTPPRPPPHPFSLSTPWLPPAFQGRPPPLLAHFGPPSPLCKRHYPRDGRRPCRAMVVVAMTQGIAVGPTAEARINIRYI